MSSNLWKAAGLGHVKTVERIVKSGDEDVNAKRFDESCRARYKECYGLLYWMAEKTQPCSPDHIKIGKILIEHGADVNSYDNMYKTPVLYAIKEGNLEWTEFLLQNGAKLMLKDSEKNIKLLVHNLFFIRDIRNRRRGKQTKAMLTLLIQYGLDTKMKDASGKNLLHQLIYYYTFSCDPYVVEISEVLINNGVSVNDCDKGGNIPLFYCISKGHLELALFLIDKGADVNKKGKHQNTVLHFAAEHGDVDFINLFLLKGADIHAKNDRGRTAIHIACIESNEKSIALLIQKGADICMEDNLGNTPFSHVKSYLNSFLKINPLCVKIMVKEFSKLIFEKVPVSKIDETLIRSDPHSREQFENFTSELEKMSNTKFYGTHSYYSMLKMSKNIKKLACLTRIPNFVENFEKNLNNFDLYKDDLRRIIQQAIKFKDEFEAVYLGLNSVFRNFFPDLVIRKLADNLAIEKLQSSQA